MGAMVTDSGVPGTGTDEATGAEVTGAEATGAEATGAEGGTEAGAETGAPAAAPGDADDQRLAEVEERIDDARRAADDLADTLDVSEDERAVAKGETPPEPQGGTEVTPG
jgi:hypothetical protein